MQTMHPPGCIAALQDRRTVDTLRRTGLSHRTHVRWAILCCSSMRNQLKRPRRKPTAAKPAKPVARSISAHWPSVGTAVADTTGALDSVLMKLALLDALCTLPSACDAGNAPQVNPAGADGNEASSDTVQFAPAGTPAIEPVPELAALNVTSPGNVPSASQLA